MRDATGSGRTRRDARGIGGDALGSSNATARRNTKRSTGASAASARRCSTSKGGIVADIPVREGDLVAAGRELVVLGDTQARAAFSLLRAQHRSAAALKTCLGAERDGLAEVRWPAALWGAVAADAGDDVLATQERIFQARARSLDNRTAIHRRRIEQLRAEAAGLEEEIGIQDRQLALLEEETAARRGLVARGVEGKPRLLALRRTKVEGAGARARHGSQVARVGQRVEETFLTIAELGNERLSGVVAELREVETRMPTAPPA